MNDDNQAFVDGFDLMGEAVHENAVRKGWWEDPRNHGEAIALMHSELSEALEAMRTGGGFDMGSSAKIPQYSAVEEELADVIIRIMDFAGGTQIDVAGAIVAKHEYNKGRPHKHGKKF